MAVLPLKKNKETSAVMEDILLGVARKNWLSILSGNALKILVLFSAKQKGGEALIGDYSLLTKETGLARGSVAVGLNELEAFGFISFIKVINRKTKIYLLSNCICNLSDEWVLFFENAKYKKFCIDALLGKKIDNKEIDAMQLAVANGNNTFLEKTLGRLLFLFVERSGFTIEDLLEEERTKMQEDLFPEGFGFGMNGVEEDNWQSILTSDEKKDKHLMDILTHYVALVDYPDRKDVELIKKAYVFCYPYQIKNAITNVKNHPKYGVSFKSFSYIYNRVINGQYGTRKNSNAKNKFNNEQSQNKSRKPNNQTDVGFKTLEISREEIIERLDNVSVNNGDLIQGEGSKIEEQAFDFNLLRS